MIDPDKPLIIGLNNPYSRRSEDALLPWPAKAAGWRLYRAIAGVRPGFDPELYVESFARMNLWRGALPKNRRRALLYREGQQLLKDIDAAGVRNVVCLGALVWGALVSSDDSIEWLGYVDRGHSRFWKLPHPSGANPMFAQPSLRERIGVLLLSLLPADPR